MTDGWRCPGCGCCYAPHVDQCGRCSGSSFVVVVTEREHATEHVCTPGALMTSGRYCTVCGKAISPPEPPTIICAPTPWGFP